MKSDGSTINTGGAPVATETTGDAGETTDQVTVSKADYDALVAKAAKADTKAEDDTEDEKDMPAFLKKDALPEPISKAFEEQAARLAKAEESVAAATAVAKAERDARLNAEYVTKAEGYKHLPIAADKFGPVLRSIDECLPAEHSAEVLRLFKAASESEAFASIAKNFGSPAAGSGTAWDRISKAASDLAADGSMTHAQAVDRVLTTQPDLAAAYVAERG